MGWEVPFDATGAATRLAGLVLRRRDVCCGVRNLVVALALKDRSAAVQRQAYLIRSNWRGGWLRLKCCFPLIPQSARPGRSTSKSAAGLSLSELQVYSDVANVGR